MSKPQHLLHPLTIPDHWSPDEALVVVSFLKRISESIWAAHGDEMAQRLYRSDDLGRGAPLQLPRPTAPTQDDDEFPF